MDTDGSYFYHKFCSITPAKRKCFLDIYMCGIFMTEQKLRHKTNSPFISLSFKMFHIKMYAISVNFEKYWRLEWWLRTRRTLINKLCETMFHWEPEGRYRHALRTAPFWFSTKHRWIVITPFWLSTDNMPTCTAWILHYVSKILK